jgi:hypothetical protein
MTSGGGGGGGGGGGSSGPSGLAAAGTFGPLSTATAEDSITALVIANRGAPMATNLPGGGDYMYLAECYLAKMEGACVAIVFDHAARGSDLPPYDPSGYVVPPFVNGGGSGGDLGILQLEPVEQPTGLAAWPVLFAVPPGFPLRQHLPGIVSLILEGRESLTNPRAVVRHWEPRADVGVYLAGGGNGVYVVAVHGSRKKAAEKATVEFLCQMTALMSGVALVSALRELGKGKGK